MSQALIAAAAAQKGPIWQRILARLGVEAVCAEPVGGWWTGNAQFGRQFTMTQPPAENELVDLMNTEAFPGPPRLISCTLFRDFPTNAGPINADIQAQIIYGSGGTSNTILMDWANGGSFAIQANTLRISAVSRRVEATTELGASQPYNRLTGAGQPARFVIGATVGIDGAPPPLPPTFTTDAFWLAGATTQMSFRVPEFARTVIPVLATDVVSTIVPANYNISILGDVFNLARYNLTEGILREGLELPRAARFVNVEKVGAAPNARVHLLFKLGL